MSCRISARAIPASRRRCRPPDGPPGASAESRAPFPVNVRLRVVVDPGGCIVRLSA